MIKLARDMRPGELFVVESSGEVFECVGPSMRLPCFHFVMLRRDQYTSGGPQHVMKVASLHDVCRVLPAELAKQSAQAIADAMDDWIAVSQTSGAQ